LDKWIMVGLAAVLAATISLIWLGTVGYLLLEVWGLSDPNRFGLVEVTVGLAAVTLVPVLIWLLAGSAWRSTRLSQALGRIKTTLAKVEPEGGLQGEVRSLREASETATAQLPRAADDAKQQRGALAEFSEPMTELTIQLHGVLGQMRDFGERAERTQGNLRAIVDHIAEVCDAVLSLLHPQDRPGRDQRRLETAITQSIESGECALSRLEDRARALSGQGGSLQAPAPEQLLQERQIEARPLRRADFLSAASALIQALNKKAVELNAFLQVDIPPEVLVALKEGDHSALLRRLRRLKDRSGVRGLALHYRHDREFRLTPDRFMETFEVLLEDAREADPSNGLGAVFVTSDLGKLYLAFARESGRAGVKEQDRS